MAISDKLTYLNTTKGKIKDTINLTGANILSEDTFRSYADKLKQGLVDAINDGGSTIYSNFPKTTGEGTEITLNNTYAAPMGTTLKGNTSQNGTPTPDSPIDIQVVTGNNTINVCGKNLFDKTITKSQGDGRIGDTALETGKKLTWNGASATTGYMWLGYVIKDVTNYVGKTVRFKTNFSASASNTPQYAIGICDSDGDNRTSKASSSTSGNTLSFTIPSLSGTQTYLYVLLYANSGGTLNPNDYVDYTDMILTIDNEDMVYQPYQSSNYSINLGSIELCKIGDYQDYIYKSGDKWYKKAYIGKVVLDGSENWTYYSVTQGSLFRSNNSITNGANDTTYVPYSNYYQGISQASSGNRKNNTFYININNIDIIDNKYVSANDFKTWLSNNNTIVYYVLNTPTNTEITDTTLIEQLEELEKAKSVENKTIISQTNADLPFIISASALSKN